MIACLYDVHGNLPALEAVLGDARSLGAERWLLGGDYALFGPHPAECVETLQDLPDATWIRGNADRWTAHPEDAPEDPVVRSAIAACRASLGEARVEELDALPESAVLDGTRFVHGSPLSDVRSFLPEPHDDERELLGGIDEQRLVFGHTHLPFRRVSPHGGIELVNPGSVGLPFDGDRRASYALLLDDGTVEHRRVDYDRAAAVAALAEHGDPAWAQRSARRLETARPDA